MSSVIYHLLQLFLSIYQSADVKDVIILLLVITIIFVIYKYWQFKLLIESERRYREYNPNAKRWTRERRLFSKLIYSTYKDCAGRSDLQDLKELILRVEYQRLNGFSYDFKHTEWMFKIYKRLSTQSKKILEKYLYFDAEYLKETYKYLKFKEEKPNCVTKTDLTNICERIICINPTRMNTYEEITRQLKDLYNFDFYNYDYISNHCLLLVDSLTREYFDRLEQERLSELEQYTAQVGDLEENTNGLGEIEN